MKFDTLKVCMENEWRKQKRRKKNYNVQQRQSIILYYYIILFYILLLVCWSYCKNIFEQISNLKLNRFSMELLPLRGRPFVTSFISQQHNVTDIFFLYSNFTADIRVPCFWYFHNLYQTSRAAIYEKCLIHAHGCYMMAKVDSGSDFWKNLNDFEVILLFLNILNL